MASRVKTMGYINAHGTGTAANDKVECAAVADAFWQCCGQLDDVFDEIHGMAI